MASTATRPQHIAPAVDMRSHGLEQGNRASRRQRAQFDAITALRRASQTAFAVLFVALLLAASVAGVEGLASSKFFFAIDPLLAVTEVLATEAFTIAAVIALIPVVLTLLVGRFFCGWVCPMGAVNHLTTWISSRCGRRPKIPDLRWTPTRYVILGTVLVLAATGSRLGVLFDPLALLSRSLSAFALPALHLHVDPWSVTTPPPGDLPGAVRSDDGTAQEETARQTRQAVLQAAGIGGVFLLVVLLNLHTRRFSCAYLCPLGALYGLVARLSLLRLRVEETCTNCSACSRACPSGAAAAQSSPQDCLVCTECLVECPRAAKVFGLWRRDASEPTPLDPGRRHLLASLVAGLGVSGIISLAPTRASATRRFIRPPGALHEAEFLSRCLRCGQCLQACPTGFLQPAGFESGGEGLWTPIGEPATGECAWDCNLCTRVCPTGAIQQLSLVDKQRFKIGTAVVDRSRCYTWADGMNCTVCLDNCPLPASAIRLHEEPVWDFAGERTTVNRVHVDSDLCTGCGVCEHVCPRFDAPGIKIGCDDEQRGGAFDVPQRARSRTSVPGRLP